MSSPLYDEAETALQQQPGVSTHCTGPASLLPSVHQLDCQQLQFVTDKRSMPAAAAFVTYVTTLLLLLLLCYPRELFAALDRCEEMLGRGRYLLGSTLTEADVRLFMTLIRFDEVYVSGGAADVNERL